MTSVVSRSMKATPEEVWAVLADGWLFGLWVVGASRIRDVDATWPDPDARIHHSVGAWPIVINDTTSVVTSKPNRELEMLARAWPGGEARVRMSIEVTAGGSLVTMTEDASNGPARFVPPPIRVPILDWRNTESLARLSYLAEGRRPLAS